MKVCDGCGGDPDHDSLESCVHDLKARSRNLEALLVEAIETYKELCHEDVARSFEHRGLKAMGRHQGTCDGTVADAVACLAVMTMGDPDDDHCRCWCHE